MAIDRNVRLAGSDQVGVTVGELVDAIKAEVLRELPDEIRRVLLHDLAAPPPGGAARPT